MDPAVLCENPSWSSHSFMHHHILCDLFREIHGVQEMQVSVMMTHNTELVHRLLSGVLKFGLHDHIHTTNTLYTDLLIIHWGIHIQSGWNALEHYLAETTPVTESHCCLALVKHNFTFNTCNTTNSSIKEIWTNDITGSYTCTIFMCCGRSYVSSM